jgi:hypothetical protein
MIGAFYGAAAMGCATVAIIFLRYWRSSRDRLFVMFSGAFWILAAHYAIVASQVVGVEWRPYVFGIRLIAFTLLIFAIVEKNSGRGSRPQKGQRFPSSSDAYSGRTPL